jgi:hypothetical protein
VAWTLPVKRVHANSGASGEAAALITELSEPTLPGAVKLIEFWRACQPDGVVVGRDVPSREIAPLLSSLVLFEPIDDGGDWRIRLAGAALLRRFGHDVTGSLISKLYPHDHFEIIRSRAAGVLEMNKPHTDDVVIKNSERTLQHFETVHLPVYAPGRAARWDMAGYFYFE